MSSYIKPVLKSAWKVISWPLFGQSRKANAFWAFLMTVALLTNVYAFKANGTGWNMFWIVVTAMILGTKINNFIYNRHVNEGEPRYTEKELDEVYLLLHETEMDNTELRRQITILENEVQFSTLAAENATLRAYNSELCDSYNSQLVKLAHQDDELATLRASEAAIRALITPAQHDALAAHVAAEVAKARAEDAELITASLALKEIVEGISGAMDHGTFRAEKGTRLKDTPEWVAFYVALAQIGAKP